MIYLQWRKPWGNYLNWWSLLFFFHFIRNFRFFLVGLSHCFTVPYPCKVRKLPSHQRSSKKGLFVHTPLSTTLSVSVSQLWVFKIIVFSKRQFLAGRSGGATVSQVEPVGVEDERVEDKNQDDGWGPDKETGETSGGRGSRGFHSVMVTVAMRSDSPFLVSWDFSNVGVHVPFYTVRFIPKLVPAKDTLRVRHRDTSSLDPSLDWVKVLVRRSLYVRSLTGVL